MDRNDFLSEYRKGRRNFSNMNLEGIRLNELTLVGVDFSRSNLSSANFSNSKLYGCSFVESDFSYADLSCVEFASLADFIRQANSKELLEHIKI